MASEHPAISRSEAQGSETPFLARIEAEIQRDPAARESGALARLEPFFALALHNHSIRDTDLDNALKFLDKKTATIGLAQHTIVVAPVSVSLDGAAIVSISAKNTAICIRVEGGVLLVEIAGTEVYRRDLGN